MPPKKEIDFTSQGPLVSTTLVSRVDTLDDTSQATIDAELTWLMSAADILYKIALKTVGREHEVPVAVPGSAVKKPGANNRLLATVDAFYLETIWPIKLEGAYNQLIRHQKNLDLLLDREAKLGGDALSNIALQNQIAGVYADIVRVLEELAALAEEAYGVRITSPTQLADLLE